MEKIQVLFVCMGNICRSPTAEGVFRQLVQEEGLADLIGTDSAGTHAYHVGEQPDRRAQVTAHGRGIDLSDLRARRVSKGDFDKFHYILAMDNDNYGILEELCPDDRGDRLSMFLEFASGLAVREVPDPYFGGPQGFEDVFDMVEAASKGLLDDIRRQFLNNK